MILFVLLLIRSIYGQTIIGHLVPGLAFFITLRVWIRSSNHVKVYHIMLVIFFY